MASSTTTTRSTSFVGSSRGKRESATARGMRGRARASRGDESERVPDGTASAATDADRRLFAGLASRRRAIGHIKRQRSRVSVGDYVSDECTVLRGERFAVERKLHDVKRDLSARLALERYDEAKEIQALVIELECERDLITREIEREQTTLLRHLDELY